jgi:hypothetical protein
VVVVPVEAPGAGEGEGCSLLPLVLPGLLPLLALLLIPLLPLLPPLPPLRLSLGIRRRHPPPWLTPRRRAGAAQG